MATPLAPAPAPLPEHLYGPLTRALPGAQPDGARWMGEGWGAVAFCLRDPGGGGDWVLRVPREGVPWAAADLEREVRMLPLLATRPFEVRVPSEAQLVVDDQGAILGALHRLVPGTPLEQVVLPRGGARRTLHADIGRFLAVLHDTPAEAARAHGVEERDLWTEVYVPRIEATLPLLGKGARGWLTSEVEAFEQAGGTKVERRVLIHGDISGDHLLVDDTGRLSGVIDFAEARLSDPALDFAGVLNRLRGRDLEEVFAAYSGPVDDSLRRRIAFYIAVAPIFSATDGYVALGEAERRRGLRRLAARAARRHAAGRPGTM